jgi:hypothetical protein
MVLYLILNRMCVGLHGPPCGSVDALWLVELAECCSLAHVMFLLQVSVPEQEKCVFATDLVPPRLGFCLHFVLLFHQDLGSGNVGGRPRSSVMWNTYHDLSTFADRV